MQETTLCIVKPHAYAHRFEIAGMIEPGLDISLFASPYQFSEEVAGELYAPHAGKGFFKEIVDALTEGHSALMLVSGEDAVDRMAMIAGRSRPSQAAPGSIRARFGRNLTYNAVHIPNSITSAAREAELLFGERSLTEYASELSRYFTGLKRSK